MVTTRASNAAASPVKAVEDAPSESAPSSDDERTKSTLSLMLSPFYFLTLIVRAACILLPGYIHRGEFHAGQEAVYAMFFASSPHSTMDLPVGMTSEAPTTSIVPSLITSFVPYAVRSYLGLRDPISAVLFPRVWMLAISVVIDAMTLQTMNFVGGAGRQGVFFLLTTSWATLVCFVRPMTDVVETLAVVGLLFSLLGIGSEVPRMAGFCVFLVLGVFCRTSFLTYLGVLILYVVTMASKPHPRLVPLIGGALLAVVALLGTFALLGAIDSFYYGALHVTVDGTLYESLADFVQDLMSGALDLATLVNGVSFSVNGPLIIPPMNVLGAITLSTWREKLQGTFAPAQLFFYFPLVAGPLAVALAVESWDSLKKMYRELMVEVRGANSGATKRKKKTRKVPEAAKAREEENATFSDVLEMTLTLSICSEVLFGASTSGLGAVLPALIPAIFMFHDKFTGPKAFKHAGNWWMAYNVVAVVAFGLLHHGGSLRVALAAAQGDAFVEGQMKPSRIFFYNSYAPPNYLLGENDHQVKLTSLENVTTSERVYSKLLHLQQKEPDAYAPVVVCPATTPLSSELGFERVAQLNGHLSLDHFPKNIDALFTKARLDVYKVIFKEDDLKTTTDSTDLAGTPDGAEDTSEANSEDNSEDKEDL